MATLDAIVTNFLALFEQEMGLVMTLQEERNLQILNTEVRELQKQYDEVKAMTRSIALVQRLVKLEEGKQLLV